MERYKKVQSFGLLLIGPPVGLHLMLRSGIYYLIVNVSGLSYQTKSMLLCYVSIIYMGIVTCLSL